MDRPCGFSPPASDQVPFYDLDGTLGSCIECAAQHEAPLTFQHDSGNLHFFDLHRYSVQQVFVPRYVPHVCGKHALVWLVTTIATV